MSLDNVLGVWDTWLDQFVYGPCYTRAEAETALVDQGMDYLAADEDPDVLEIRHYCSEHWPQEQPADDCDICRDGGDPEYDEQDEREEEGEEW